MSDEKSESGPWSRDHDEMAKKVAIEQTVTRFMLNEAAPDLLEVCRRILVNCSRGRASRHQFADSLGSLAGCSMSLEDIKAARIAVMKATGHDEFPDQNRSNPSC